MHTRPSGIIHLAPARVCSACGFLHQGENHRTGNSEVYIQKIRNMGTDSNRNVPFTDATVFKLTIPLALSSVRILAQNRLSKRAKRKREDVYTGMRHGKDMEANEAEAVDRPGGERAALPSRQPPVSISIHLFDATVRIRVYSGCRFKFVAPPIILLCQYASEVF